MDDNTSQGDHAVAKKCNTTGPDGDSPSFEVCLEELEAIVAELESGKLGLAEALARYEQGVKHLKSCHQLLERAQRQIELLSGIDAEGNPITEPYGDRELASLEEKAAARGRRRSSESAAERPDQPRGGRDVDDARRLF